MIKAEDLVRLYKSSLQDDLSEYREIQKELENPSRDDMVAGAIKGMNDSDRNVRIIMLRILEKEKTEEAMKGILLGLHDEKRRVREIAVKISRFFLNRKEIVDKLKEIIENANEKRKIRNKAFEILTGDRIYGEHAGELPGTILSYLKELSKLEEYKSRLFYELLHLDMVDDVKELLEDYVKNGTKEQAVMATKALCGYKAIHHGMITDPEEKEKIVKKENLAYGQVFYWVKREKTGD
ncbi:MAG: hypothetical protein JXB88_07710 [Spirochaetales bacterium]|nr:hypothetical protein [Spirochaetales bacterium]